MFGLVMSAIWGAVAWFARAILFKAVLYIALFFFTSEAMAYFGQQITLDAGSLTGLMSQLVGGSEYFISVAKLDVGIPAILAAYVTRFSIRRLPIIG